MEKVYVKGMVCSRCISIVKYELESIGLQLNDISLGEVTLAAKTKVADLKTIGEQLKPYGFTLLEDKRTKLVRDVKQIVAEIYGGDFDFPAQFRFSTYISTRLQRDFDIISSIFSAQEYKTLEKYIIEFRIEKVKEYLLCSRQTLADISFRLGFSSVAHLSNQFKTVSGITPSDFRIIQGSRAVRDCN